MSPSSSPAICSENLALTRVGPYTVAVESDRISRLLQPGKRPSDADIAVLIGASELVGEPSRLLELEHAAGRLVIALHGPIRLERSSTKLPCFFPALIASTLQQSCLKGVVKHPTGLAFVLDVDRLATARLVTVEENISCESD